MTNLFRFATVLTFSVFAAACARAEDAPAAEAPASTGAPELVVIDVAPNDVLNIRAEPNANAAIVGTLAPDTGGIRATAQSTQSLDWIHIAAGGVEGWANANFLGYATPFAPLPVRLTCSGTEPFWGVELSYTRGDVTYAFRDEDFTAGFSAPGAPLNRAGIWVMTRFDDDADFLVLEAETCSDGMSETQYDYALLAKLDGNLLGGCCR